MCYAFSMTDYLITDKDQLYEDYITKGLHAQDVANKYGVGLNTVRRALKRFHLNKSMRFPTEFTTQQKSLLYGTLMGDGHLDLQNRGIEACYRAGHTSHQKDYIQHKFNILKPYVRMRQLTYYEDFNRIKADGNPLSSYRFSTVAHPLLTDIYKEFYINDIKILTRDILDKIDAEALAYWYQDDGSSHIVKNAIQKIIKISTCNFTWEENYIIKNWFKDKWNINTSVYYQKVNKTYPTIHILSSQADKFYNIVRPYILPSMAYKILDS